VLSPSSKNFPRPLAGAENISILVVSSHPEDRVALNRILHNDCYRFTNVSSVAEASSYLERADPTVIVCERDLPDGRWSDIPKNSEDAPAVVVISRQADDALWSSVLNGGGYDVLQKPFERSEVTRVLGMAWRNTCSRRNAHAHAGTGLTARA
jgi:DNA-binding NtrC family response regulator